MFGWMVASFNEGVNAQQTVVLGIFAICFHKDKPVPILHTGSITVGLILCVRPALVAKRKNMLGIDFVSHFLKWFLRLSIGIGSADHDTRVDPAVLAATLVKGTKPKPEKHVTLSPLLQHSPLPMVFLI